MTLNVTNNLVLALQTINENAGRLCFKNIVNSQNISSFLGHASDSTTSYPASNMANPSTAFGWEAPTTIGNRITVENPSREPVDYIGIARHNLNQAGLTMDVFFDGTLVISESSFTEKQAKLLLFEEAAPAEIELRFFGATNPPKIAVLQIGKSLKLERNIYVGHTPINYGRDISQVSGVSQSGEYLGEIRLNQTLSTSVSLKNLTPDWYRENLDEFFSRVPRYPCFWAWRPTKYPAEVSYCWIEGNPRPVNQRSNGMMQIDWNFRGIA